MESLEVVEAVFGLGLVARVASAMFQLYVSSDLFSYDLVEEIAVRHEFEGDLARLTPLPFPVIGMPIGERQCGAIGMTKGRPTATRD